MGISALGKAKKDFHFLAGVEPQQDIEKSLKNFPKHWISIQFNTLKAPLQDIKRAVATDVIMLSQNVSVVRPPAHF